MHGVGILRPPSAPPLYHKPITNYHPICSTLAPQCKTHKNHLFLRPQLQHKLSSLTLLERNGFCLFAQKKLKDSNFSRIEAESQDFEDGFDGDEEDYEEFDDDDDEFDEDLDDDDDDLMVPFDKIDAWLEKKPKGFGEGKEYDTSLEDKLLEELEKSKKAQLANLEKLKNESKEPQKELKKEVQVSVVVPGVVRVRINNLPRKRNIQRDLKSAFKEVHGIINILPVVSGTKKTRDPVCKGFSFVDFKSVEDADRFVQIFSDHNITFGKMEKRIKCEMLKPRDTSSEDSVHDQYHSTSTSEEEGIQLDVIEESVLQSEILEEDDDEFHEDPDDTNVIGDHKTSSLMEQDDDIDDAESVVSPSLDSLTTKLKEKKAAVKKKSMTKKKPANNSKLNIPGSAKSLKAQDKAKLADVFNRYGVKQAVASKEM